MDGSREVANLWSGTYRNHQIAVQKSDRDWQVVLDESLISGLSFDTTDEAIAWLRRCVDGKIAEEIFPGLASSNFGFAT